MTSVAPKKATMYFKPRSDDYFGRTPDLAASCGMGLAFSSNAVRRSMRIKGV